MNPHKKNIELTGSLIYPIEVGEAAFIREADGMRRTSTVLRTKKISAQEICFETVNTHLFQTRCVLLPPIKWRKNGTEKPMTRK